MKSGVDVDYQLSMDDSGNELIYIARNYDSTCRAPIDQLTDAPYQTKRNFVNSGGQNLKDFDLNSAQKNEVGPENYVRWEEHTSDKVDKMKDSASKMTHNNSNKQGYITIHYNDPDFVKDLYVNENTALNKVKLSYDEHPKVYNNGLNESGSCFESKYCQLRKEYIERGRAKEMEYQLQRQKGDTSKDMNKSYTIIRYDIAAPVDSATLSTDAINTKLGVVGTENRVKSDARNIINRKDGHNSPIISSSKSLDRFDSKFVRNTRFGSHAKITAYRPSTCLDDHRKKKLENIIESPVNDIDFEEGRQIWKEVDAITEESLVPLPKSRRKMNCKFRDIHKSNNSVEFLPSFEREPSYKESAQTNIWNLVQTNGHDVSHTKHDDLPVKSFGFPGNQEAKPSLSFKENGTHYGRLHRSKYGSDHGIRRYSSAPILQGTNRHGNMIVVDDHSGIEKVVDTFESYYGPGGKIRGPHRKTSNICHSCLTQEHGIGSNKYIPQSGVCNETGLRMTTTLPRIAPANTPLPPGVCQSIPPRSHSSASMYGPYPPKELSSSVDFLKVPGRINPLAPPPPRKRINWSWETVNQHWENDKRRILMQTREHTRYHSAWSKAFYGAPAEKEAYRRHFRDVLKQQMADRENSRREEMVNKVKETERAVKYDEQCRANDAQEYFRKHSYLMLYRDGNKQQMEEKWAEKRFNKVSEDRVDRERLRYNPINWSCSLK